MANLQKRAASVEDPTLRSINVLGIISCVDGPYKCTIPDYIKVESMSGLLASAEHK